MQNTSTEKKKFNFKPIEKQKVFHFENPFYMDSPKVSISDKGILYISKQLSDKYNMTDYKNIELYYCNNNKMIGMQLFLNKQQNSYNIGSSSNLNMLAFFNSLPNKKSYVGHYFVGELNTKEHQLLVLNKKNDFTVINPDFKVFQKHHNMHNDCDVTINKQFYLTFMKEFIRKQPKLFEKNKYILPLYDKDNKKIGFVFSEKQLLHGHKLHSPAGQYRACIASFFKKLSLEKVFGKYNLEEYKQDGFGTVYMLNEVKDE